jgi:hypothetical protein
MIVGVGAAQLGEGAPMTPHVVPVIDTVAGRISRVDHRRHLRLDAAVGDGVRLWP